MFLTIVCSILVFIALVLSFSNNDKIFQWQNNKFIKAEYKKSYIKISKKLLFLQGIFFIISAIANYMNYRDIFSLAISIIISLGCYSTIFTLKRKY